MTACPGDVAPLLDPLSDLYEAWTTLSTWVTAVKIQWERLQENMARARSGPAGIVPIDEVWSWLLRQLADTALLVLAMQQVADAAQAVRDQAPDDAAREIDVAIARFNAACPDLRVCVTRSRITPTTCVVKAINRSGRA